MTIREFGALSDGQMVHSVVIGSDELRAEILSWGACIRDLRYASIDHPLVLGLNSAAEYEAHSPHFGVIAGRCANRIGNGQFQLDGHNHQLATNRDTGQKSASPHHLHGGPAGMGKRVWQIADHDENFVRLELTEPDGYAGYPGAVQVICTYRINGATLQCDLKGTTDAPTLMNLAQHSYFNLDGSGTINAHRLFIPAEAVVRVDSALIPDGALDLVVGSDFDFQTLTEIGPKIIDHNYCLHPARQSEPQLAATVVTKKLSMDILTTEPGIQFYTGDKIAVPVSGLEGRHYGARAGLCLEPQIWPDAINHPHFPQAILRPGETYRQQSCFSFHSTM